MLGEDSQELDDVHVVAVTYSQCHHGAPKPPNAKSRNPLKNGSHRTERIYIMFLRCLFDLQPKRNFQRVVNETPLRTLYQHLSAPVGTGQHRSG
jgi:hypothetical protein